MMVDGGKSQSREGRGTSNIQHRTPNIQGNTNKGIRAEGYESADGFVVKKGSTAVVETVPSAHAFSVSLRQELQNSGILKQRNAQFFEFTQDYEFSSPSTAAAVLVGASINGRDFWKTQKGISLKELQVKAEDV